MGTPTSYEQYMLELINAARANPDSWAASLGIDLNEGLSAGTISSTPKQPLAFDELIIDAARSHSQWMLDNDTFSHTGVNGTDGGDRMAAAGFQFEAPYVWGENLALTGTTGNLSSDLTSYVYQLHSNLFIDEGIAGRGHRINMMYDDFREVGVGILTGTYEVYNTVMDTQNFATNYDQDVALTGVVYTDSDDNNFYTPGEGLGGITVTATGTSGTYSTNTFSSGGYTLEGLPDDTYTVQFSGSGYDTTTNTVAIAGQNVKLDWVDPQSGGSQETIVDDGEPHVYRFFNSAAGTHFYTANVEEANTVLQDMPWFTYEGIAFDHALSSDTQAEPVYRFYNSYSGSHFYTINQSEADALYNGEGYPYEGIAYYAYDQAGEGGSEELYRFFNTATGTHFYTVSEAERDSVIESLPTYTYEGVAYYVDPA